jgi:hypothetical protein
MRFRGLSCPYGSMGLTGVIGLPVSDPLYAVTMQRARPRAVRSASIPRFSLWPNGNSGFRTHIGLPNLAAVLPSHYFEE